MPSDPFAADPDTDHGQPPPSFAQVVKVVRALHVALARLQRDHAALLADHLKLKDGLAAEVERQVKAGLERHDPLRAQDRRLVPTRLLMALIPTIPALVAAWLAARGVEVPPETVDALKSSLREEVRLELEAAGYVSPKVQVVVPPGPIMVDPGSPEAP